MRLVPLAAIAIVASACLTPASFDDDAADAACGRLDECGGDDDAFDVATCEDSVVGYLGCFETHCETFDAHEAHDCLDGLAGASCTTGFDFGTTCGEVWTDCSSLALLGCLADQTFGG